MTSFSKELLAPAPLATSSLNSSHHNGDDVLEFTVTFRKSHSKQDCGSVLNDDAAQAVDRLQQFMQQWLGSRTSSAGIDVNVNLSQVSETNLACLVPLVDKLVQDVSNLPKRIEALDDDFIVQPSRFFRVGSVFQVVVTSAAGPNADINEPYYTRGCYGEIVQQKIRVMVVIKTELSSCVALPITDYDDRRAAKSNYGIIYSTKEPDALPSECPDHREGMQCIPIQVISDRPTYILSSLSRLDYSSPVTILHSARVKSFGMVHETSLKGLIQQTQAVLGSHLSIRPPPPSPSVQPPSTHCVLGDKERVDKVAYYTKVANAHPTRSSIVPYKRHQLGTIDENVGAAPIAGPRIIPQHFNIRRPHSNLQHRLQRQRQQPLIPKACI